MTKTGKKQQAENSNAEETILGYLTRTNRPYSATDIFNNLKDFGKTQVTKTLSQLAESNQIVCKAYGKQQVYVAKQEMEVSKEKLTELDLEIETKKANLEEKKEILRNLQGALNGLTNELSNEELVANITQLRKNIDAGENKLKSLSSNVVLVDIDERKKIEKQLELCSKEWKKRKRWFKDLINAITENLEIKPKALMQELGCEDD